MLTLKESEVMKDMISRIVSKEEILEMKLLLDKQMSQITELTLSAHFDAVVKEYDDVLKKLAQ